MDSPKEICGSVIGLASPEPKSDEPILDLENDMVGFDGGKDPADPENWSPIYKWFIVVLVSLMSLIVNLAILLCAPATPLILIEFNSNNQIKSTLLVSVWELGEVIGPLIVGPLSEIIGRLPVYHAANILFILFSIGAAESRSLDMLIAFRFLNGLTVASTTLNSCIVSDMFKQEERGRAISVMGMTPFIAPVLGPTVGGFISQAIGWRWTFWLVAIITGAFEVCFLATYRSGLLFHSVIRPFKLLFLSPVVLLVSLCGGIACSYTYVIITSLGQIYEQVYGFAQGPVGLSFWGLGFGMIFSVISCSLTLDWYLKKKRDSLGQMQPEYRLPPMVLGIFLIPLGMFIFAWTVQVHAPWIIPILATGFIGFGFVATSLAVSTYLVDAFGIYAASAVAAATVVRNMMAAVLPLAGPLLYEKLGYGWGYSTFAFIALFFLPIPPLLMKYGGRLRQSSKFKIQQ